MAKASTINENFLIINNVKMPIPAPGMTIDSGIGVDGGRNANNEVVGQKVGRRIWKINNLAWHCLTEEEVQMIYDALQPFYVKVTFRSPDGKVRTHTMYPGDMSGKPLALVNMKYNLIEELRFNLIDCGYMSEKYEDE